ncbi:MAG: hypothetical protein ACX930_08440 [Erythrobacter sp.]
MYTADFFRSKLGRASIASIAAMAVMIVATSQVNLATEDASFAQPSAESTMLVELA